MGKVVSMGQNINIEEISCFRFVLPKDDIGLSDVELTVEYGLASKADRVFVYNVWARVGVQSTVRGMVFTGKTTADTGGAIDKIIREINLSDEFYQMLHKYLDHVVGNA